MFIPQTSVGSPVTQQVHDLCTELLCLYFLCFPLLLLLLRSPARSLGFIILGEMFAYVTVFFNPTIEVVTFRLRGFCFTLQGPVFHPWDTREVSAVATLCVLWHFCPLAEKLKLEFFFFFLFSRTACCLLVAKRPSSMLVYL